MEKRYFTSIEEYENAVNEENLIIENSKWAINELKHRLMKLEKNIQKEDIDEIRAQIKEIEEELDRCETRCEGYECNCHNCPEDCEECDQYECEDENCEIPMPRKSNKNAKAKSGGKRKSSQIKTISKTPKANDIDKGKKHEIVSLSEFNKYDYEKRRKEWHRKAGYNQTPRVCNQCRDDDNYATIKLENGAHICYFCWIKKPNEQKPKGRR